MGHDACQNGTPIERQNEREHRLSALPFFTALAAGDDDFCDKRQNFEEDDDFHRNSPITEML
jgi:hypothetical protein